MAIDWNAQPLGEMADAEIARRLGCHRTAVTRARTRLGIVSKSPRRPWTPEEDERLSGVWWFSHHPREFTRLAKALGRTVAALHQRASDLGYTRRCSIEERWPRPLHLVVKDWGYSRKRLLAVFDAAGIQFQRSSTGRKSWILVYEKDVPLMRAALLAQPDGVRVRRKR